MLDLINAAQAVVNLPDFQTTQDFGQFVGTVFTFSLSAVGLAVFIQFLRAGFIYFTAAGNTAKAGEATKLATNAVIGLLILLSAYVILYIINPDLVGNTFRLPVFENKTTNLPPSGQLQSTNPTSASGQIKGFPGSGAVVSSAENGYALGTRAVKAQTGSYYFTVEVTDDNGDSCRQDYSIFVDINPYVSRGSVAPSSGWFSRLFNPARANEHDPDFNNEENFNETGESDFVDQVESETGTDLVADCSSVQFLTQVLPDAVENMPYSAEIVAVGGQGPYIYSIIEGDLPDGLNFQATEDSPILILDNLTADREPSYFFFQGDKYRFDVANGEPNSPVLIKKIKNGEVWESENAETEEGWEEVGETDEQGKFSLSGTFGAEETGVWYAEIIIGGQVSNAVGFEVVDPSVKVTVSAEISADEYEVVREVRRAETGRRPISASSASAIAPCVEQTFCGNPLTNQEILVGTGAACPENWRTRRVCVYPQENPTDECSGFQNEFKACVETMNSVKNDDGTINTSGLPDATNSKGTKGNAPGDLFVVPQLINGIPVGQLVQCQYSNQAAAARCGMGWSGELCLPGQTAGANSPYCY